MRRPFNGCLQRYPARAWTSITETITKKGLWEMVLVATRFLELTKKYVLRSSLVANKRLYIRVCKAAMARGNLRVQRLYLFMNKSMIVEMGVDWQKSVFLRWAWRTACVNKATCRSRWASRCISNRNLLTKRHWHALQYCEMSGYIHRQRAEIPFIFAVNGTKAPSPRRWRWLR